MDYVEAFENLKPNEKYGRKTPHKAVLLLTIIEMCESDEIFSNEIRYNQQLIDTFHKVWESTLPMTILYLWMRISHFGLCKMKIFGICSLSWQRRELDSTERKTGKTF